MSKGFLLGILMILGVLMYIMSSVIRMSSNPPQPQQQQQASQTTGKPAQAPTKQQMADMKKEALLAQKAAAAAAAKAKAKAASSAKGAPSKSTPSYVIDPSDQWFNNGEDGEKGLKAKQTTPNSNSWQ